MNMMRWFAMLSLIAVTQSLIAAIDPTLDWYSIESEHLIVHYAGENKSYAETAVAIAERVHRRYTRYLDWEPLEKTHIVISDETDSPNGYATPIYFNRTVLFLAPPTSINTLEDFDDWFTTLITHEYLHIIHLDKSDGAPESLRSIFGRFQFLFPNVFQPSWVLEGLATHNETDTVRGIGRGQSTMYQLMMREEVRNGIQPLDHVNLPVNTWPGGGTRYLYGTYFMDYVAEQQDEQALLDWVQGYSNNLLPFFINTNAKQTLGQNLTPIWQDYSDWLKQKFVPQIDQITKAGIKQGEPLTDDAYNTASVEAIGDEVYFVRNNGYTQAALMKVDASGEIKQLTELNGSASIDVHSEKGILISQDEYCNRYHIYRDIYRYDEKDDEMTRLTWCGRYLSAEWHPTQPYIYTTHHDAGVMSIQRLTAEGEFIDEPWRGEKGEVLGEIDISPDGETLVAAVWRYGDGWNIEQFEIASGQWRPITHGTAIENNPQYTPDGDILFAHEADHAYNLYRYHSDTHAITKISNVMGGAFQSTQGKTGGPIYYEGYTAEGHGIFRLDDSSDIAVVDVSDDTRLMDYDYVIDDHARQDYSPWPSMRPRWWFPVFGYGDQRAPLGVSTAGSDALAFHNYLLSAAWDFKLDAFEGSIAYRYTDRLFLSLRRRNDITLDVNNDLAFSSAHDVAGASIAFPQRKLLSQHEILAGVFYDRSFLNKRGTTTAPVPDSEDNIIGLAWLYNSSRRYPLSISRNDGMNLRLVAEDSDVLGSDFSGQIYTLDWKQFIRTGDESVLALRFVQGWGTEEPAPFKLGGEDAGFNALAFLFSGLQEGVFDKRKYALRGYREGASQLTGRRAQLLTAEWRFPIQRNERGIMAPPIGLMQWSGSVFAEAGTAYRDSPEEYYSSAGFEINVDTNLFYLLSLRLRIGYAHGFDDEIGDDRLYLTAGTIF